MSHQPLQNISPVPMSYLRHNFARTALFTALAGSLIGFGATPALAADNSAEARTTANNTLANSINGNNQVDTALDALRLKKAVDDGIIEQSVLDEYIAQNLHSRQNPTNPPPNPVRTNEGLQQQAVQVQQQGYQMMTPAQIERELAAINALNKRWQNADFDAPVATLQGGQPIGLDSSLEGESLPSPSNFETLRIPEYQEAGGDNAEVLARPIEVSDSVSSRPPPASIDINKPRTGAQVSPPVTASPAINKADSQTRVTDGSETVLNPDDYLPDYEVTTDSAASSNALEPVSTPKPRAPQSANIVKRLYNRLFNGGVMPLPHVETTVYIQQTPNEDAASATLIKADKEAQPFSNMKAALDDMTLQSVVDFTAALPRLRQTALDAAKAVGYYDVTLRLRQPDSDSIDIIIERLGEPVRVESRVLDIRGEGSEQAEFQALARDLPPKVDDIFNHRVYKNSKAALESLSSTYGYFDEYWLNKSVDIILPDNTADVSLIYNTGARYAFDDVIFFTYDKQTNTLTRDPDKLPVEMSLLQQLVSFEPGAPFYRPDINKLSNDLSATRYFNTVNVESILPPDERSQDSSLAFDNTPTDQAGDDEGRDINELAGDNSDANNERLAAEDIAPIEFEVDEETQSKLQAIKQKSERLSRLPNNRVLDEKPQKTDSILGKISDSISQVAKKIFPDEERLVEDENFIPPTLEGRLSPEQVQQNKKVPLYVFVSADKPRDAQVGMGYGTDTGIRATGKIDYNLINRRGHQAGAEVEVSRINKNVTVYGTRPWKHPLNDKLQTRLTYKEETIDQGKGNFDLSTKTLKASLSRNILKEDSWDRSYFVRYRLDELETGLNVADLEDLPVRFITSKPKQKALLFGYGVSKSDVDNAINPTRGFRQYYGIEAATDSILSDTDMAIIHAGVSGLYSFGQDKKHQVLGSFDSGYIWADDFADVPYKLRFFAGGDQSIRGYDYDSLSPLENGYLTGGQILAVGSAEYNYEFKPGFRAAVFTDVGNAYDKNFDTDTKVGVGMGIRWASPVGMVRVDVAAGVTEESIPVRLHLFIGSPL